jgi:hypothetical protein
MFTMAAWIVNGLFGGVKRLSFTDLHRLLPTRAKWSVRARLPTSGAPDAILFFTQRHGELISHPLPSASLPPT